MKGGGFLPPVGPELWPLPTVMFLRLVFSERACSYVRWLVSSACCAGNKPIIVQSFKSAFLRVVQRAGRHSDPSKRLNPGMGAGRMFAKEGQRWIFQGGERSGGVSFKPLETKKANFCAKNVIGKYQTSNSTVVPWPLTFHPLPTLKK